MQPKMLCNLINGKAITLSPSSLKGALDNPHMFWLEKNMRLAWPRGIFPTLPGGMDRVLKPWYDSWRAKGEFPPEVCGQGVTGHLLKDQATIDKWRSRGSGGMLSTIVTVEIDKVLYGVTFQGMIDECVEEDDKSLTPFDFKTKGSAPKAGGSEEYYQHQLNGYRLLFERNGRKGSGKAHLAYYHPGVVSADAVASPKAVAVGFTCTVEHLSSFADDCEYLVQKLISVLVGPLPEPNCHEACEYLAQYPAVLAKVKSLAFSTKAK